MKSVRVKFPSIRAPLKEDRIPYSTPGEKVWYSLQVPIVKDIINFIYEEILS